MRNFSPEPTTALSAKEIPTLQIQITFLKTNSTSRSFNIFCLLPVNACVFQSTMPWSYTSWVGCMKPPTAFHYLVICV